MPFEKVDTQNVDFPALERGVLQFWAERGIFAPTPLIWASMAYQTVVVAFISYIAWFWLVKRHAASRLSAFSFLTPLFGAACGWALLGDSLGPLFLAALALVSVGILLVNAR